MPQRFDLVVIGTGAGASAVATRCRSAGWSVAIVDEGPYGGTCALRGCEPKKVLVTVASAVQTAGKLRDHGAAGDLRIDWKDLMRFKRTFTEPVPDGTERAFSAAGIETLHGTARFEAPALVRTGDDALFEARRVHIATGARPAELRMPGAEHVTTSDRFLELDELPRRIVFLGAGFIAFEFAHVAASAGAAVTMIEARESPLAAFDPDLVALLVARTRALGIDLRLGTRVRAIERHAGALRVRASTGDADITLDADLVVHGAGRVPDLSGLQLHKAGVQHDEHGVTVNEYMQSVSNPNVYAAGDAAGSGPQLTPVAALEARVAAANLLEGNHLKAEHLLIPSAVFTLPPLAAVGLREDQARAEELEFVTHHDRTSSWASSRRFREEFSAHKILVEEGSGRILGAHLIGPRADELINVFAIAMRARMTATELKRTVFAYPTVASDIGSML